MVCVCLWYVSMCVGGGEGVMMSLIALSLRKMIIDSLVIVHYSTITK